MSRHIDLALERCGLPRLQRSAWVEVEIDTLVTNAAALVSMAAPAAIGPVVKADGYGHGLEMAARCAVAGGAQWLCVANAGEALRLRADGYPSRVFVLYPVPRSMLDAMAQADVDVTVSDVGEAEAMADSVDPTPGLRVHVEIDTGMTRGGVRVDDAVPAARALAQGRGTKVAGIWTHLAAPEDPGTTQAQLELFASVLDHIAGAGLDRGVVHAAASGGLLAIDTAEHDLVRPGLAYYGLHPGAGHPLPSTIVPALAVKACPVLIADVPPGTSVGYAGTWTAQRPSVIATLPIGYADGWSRSSSPGTFALVKGRRAPIVGRVSSDSLTVDVTGVEGVEADTEFTLLGSDNGEVVTADEIAEVRRTISWEVLQQIGGRLSRVYKSGSVPVAVRPESSIEIVTAGDDVILPYRSDLVAAESGSYDRRRKPE